MKGRADRSNPSIVTLSLLLFTNYKNIWLEHLHFPKHFHNVSQL